MKFHNISDLENMMIEIQLASEEEMLDYLDSIRNPFERAEERKLYFQALKKLEDVK